MVVLAMIDEWIRGMTDWWPKSFVFALVGLGFSVGLITGYVVAP